MTINLSKSAIAAAIAVALVVAALLSASGIAAQDSKECSFSFVAGVRFGPNEGLEARGLLKLNVTRDGSLSGELGLADGSAIPVTGTTVGQSINMIFNLGGSRYIYGVGTSLEPMFDACGGFALGGPLAGPEEGDLGDWAKIAE